MNFKPFNIHRFTNSPQLNRQCRFRGFTAVVSPGEDRTVNVEMSFCSPRDMFCRKIGATRAKDPTVPTRVTFSCNARNVLKEIQDTACAHEIPYSLYWMESQTWLFKYMI